MMSERFLWDRYLMQVRESGLIPDGGKILDVGTGMNTTVLEIFGDRWEVTPSDVNVGDWNSHIPGMIQLNAERLSDDFYDEWDAVIMSEILEHLKRPEKALDEAWKVLKPGGVLIVTVPFMYRIHEYGNLDPETTEPGLKDYWRITPSGMIEYLIRTSFAEFWVGRLVKDDIKTFPQWYCPEGIVAWARKGTQNLFSQVIHLEDSWSPELPEDWRDRQVRLAEEYERRVASAGERVEPV